MSYGKCKICGEKIAYTPDHVNNLGLHLLERHPEEDFTHFALVYEPITEVAKECSCGCGCEPGVCTRVRKPCSKRFDDIKTSVSCWKCAKNPHFCARCGKTSIPLIHRQRSKLTKSSFIECLLLGCWPLCFLPFLIAGSDLFYLYCRECGYYLGMYDRRVSVDDKVPVCRIPGTNPFGQTCDCSK